MVIDGEVLARQLDIAVLAFLDLDAQGHHDAAVGKLLDINHMAPSNGAAQVVGVKISEQQRFQGQQVTTGGLRRARLEVAVKEMVGVDHATAVEPDKCVGQEVVGGDKRILYRGVGQFAVIQGNVTGKHLGGAVPLLINVAEVLHTAVEAVNQHEWHGVLGLLRHRGHDDKVALAGSGANVEYALVIEPRTQHAHVNAAAKGVITVL